MKKLLMLSFLMYVTASWAGSEYLSVSGWQSCVKASDQKIYKYFCLPPTKPNGCSESSWSTLTKNQMLPLCPLCPPKK